MPKAINNELITEAQAVELKELLGKKVMKSIRNLWDTNFQSAIAILSESENKKVRISIPIELDFSESEARFKVGVRYSQVYSESTVGNFPNPFPKTEEGEEGQEKLAAVDAEAKEESTKIRRKRVKKALAEDSAPQEGASQEEGEDQATA